MTQKCTICGQDIRARIQPPLHARATAREYGECVNPTCRAYGITLLTVALLDLTPSTVERYPDLRPAQSSGGEDSDKE